MKYPILYFLLFLCLHANAQFFYYPFPPTKADYAKNVAAQVKTCNEYMISFGEKVLNRVLEYGNQGLPVVLYEKGINNNGDSTNIAENSYKYANGRLVLENILNHQGDDNYKIGYTYNTAGKLLKKVVVQIDPPTYTYVYDKLGRAVKASIVVRLPDENGKPFNKSVGHIHFMYNAKGQLVQQTDYSQNAQKEYNVKWQYNAKGQVVKIIRQAPSGWASEEILEYNANDLLATRTEKVENEEPTVYVYEYCTTCKQSWMK